MGICVSVPDEKRAKSPIGISSESAARSPFAPQPLTVDTDAPVENDESRLSSPEDRISPGGDRLTVLLKRSMKRVHTINDIYKQRVPSSSSPNVFTRATFSDSFLSPFDVVSEMLKGNHRFVNGNTLHPHQDFKRIAAVAPKQHPLAAVLSCADSRVPVR